MYQVMQIENQYTNTCNPNTNCQTERYCRTIASMFRFYVTEQKRDLEKYIGVLTYSYHTSVLRSTVTVPF